MYIFGNERRRDTIYIFGSPSWGGWLAGAAGLAGRGGLPERLAGRGGRPGRPARAAGRAGRPGRPAGPAGRGCKMYISVPLTSKMTSKCIYVYTWCVWGTRTPHLN